VRNVTVINFKKVVSMAVVLSLMLGACEKNPARRDGGTATDTTENLERFDEQNGPKSQSEEWVVGGALVGALVGANRRNSSNGGISNDSKSSIGML
jgi:hypothetical protein